MSRVAKTDGSGWRQARNMLEQMLNTMEHRVDFLGHHIADFVADMETLIRMTCLLLEQSEVPQRSGTMQVVALAVKSRTGRSGDASAISRAAVCWNSFLGSNGAS